MSVEFVLHAFEVLLEQFFFLFLSLHKVLGLLSLNILDFAVALAASRFGVKLVILFEDFHAFHKVIVSGMDFIYLFFILCNNFVDRFGHLRVQIKHTCLWLHQPTHSFV